MNFKFEIIFKIIIYFSKKNKITTKKFQSISIYYFTFFIISGQLI